MYEDACAPAHANPPLTKKSLKMALWGWVLTVVAVVILIIGGFVYHRVVYADEKTLEEY